MGNVYRSNYNALQVTLTSRNYHGLSMVAGYTYGHSLDEVGANWDFGYGAGLPQDSYQRRPRIREQRLRHSTPASRSRSPMPSPARKRLRADAGRLGTQFHRHPAKCATLGPD